MSPRTLILWVVSTVPCTKLSLSSGTDWWVFFWNPMKAQKTISHVCPCRTTLTPTNELFYVLFTLGINVHWSSGTSRQEWHRAFPVHFRLSLCGSGVSDVTFTWQCPASYNFWVQCWRINSISSFQKMNGHGWTLDVVSVCPGVDHSPPHVPIGNVLSFAPKLMWLLSLCRSLFWSCRTENFSLSFLWFCLKIWKVK